MPAIDALKTYREKRDFSRTPEPGGGATRASEDFTFVIQKHWASRLHYDFRLELDGTMKSWAVPKGPSLDPKIKRMAVEVEDHPIAYSDFEGEIPARQYGAGTVIIWDRGTWRPIGDPLQGYRDGNLKFVLDGEKLQGKWALIRMKGKGEKQPPWLLIKEKDEHVRADDVYRITDALPDSVGQATARPKNKKDAKKVALNIEAKKSISPVIGPATPRLTRTRIPAMPAAAAQAALPTSLAPQLATLAATAPEDDERWVYELKFDGYRLLARVDGDKIVLLTRNGHDWTDRLPQLAVALNGMQLGSAWLDGEIVVLNSAGIPDFQALQNAFDGGTTHEVVYYLFDLPYHAGHDLTKVPLAARRKRLQALMQRNDLPGLRFSAAFDVPVAELLASCRELGLEGVIGKRRDAPYVSRRSNDWIKLKCGQRQEFVIGGYTDPNGARTAFGSLLLGVHDAHGALQYAGNVGTGFSEKLLHELHGRLKAMAATKSPFAGKTDIDASAHWVAPNLLAEVAFAGWTGSGRLRHAVFQGLRIDKPAANIVRETPERLAGPRKAPAKPGARVKNETRATAATPAMLAIRITHADKIVDPASQANKQSVINYYDAVSASMMEHLNDRPVALVRAPEGVEGHLFFQKHSEKAALPGISLLDQALDPGHAPLLKVAAPIGLLSAAQMNVIEFHTWNARDHDIGRPDRMTFDLDPGQGLPWTSVQEGALLVRALLDQLGLKAFLKTSGGKGLHVVVPLRPHFDWETVKDFSHAIVNHLARTIPGRFVAKSGPANRIGKLFVDYLRNGFGATTVSAWSLRARPGLGVSVPVDWSELQTLGAGDHWTLANVAPRFAVGNTPWKSYARSANVLQSAMQKIGFVPHSLTKGKS